jgi:hypothetical protein
MKLNYLAVIVAAVAHWILGGAWYGVLNKPFSRFIGSEKMKELETRSEAKAFILAFVSSLVLSYLLARFLRHTEANSAIDGLKTTFLLWLGFIATTQLLTVLFEGRHVGLYLLNVGYQLVACSAAGLILVLWKPR